MSKSSATCSPCGSQMLCSHARTFDRAAVEASERSAWTVRPPGHPRARQAGGLRRARRRRVPDGPVPARPQPRGGDVFGRSPGGRRDLTALSRARRPPPPRRPPAFHPEPARWPPRCPAGSRGPPPGTGPSRGRPPGPPRNRPSLRVRRDTVGSPGCSVLILRESRAPRGVSRPHHA